jgi:hypothetical protein
LLIGSLVERQSAVGRRRLLVGLGVLVVRRALGEVAEVVDRVAGGPFGPLPGGLPSGVWKKPPPVMMPRPRPPPPPSCQAKSGVLISVAAADEVDLQGHVAEVDLRVVGGAEVRLELLGRGV